MAFHEQAGLGSQNFFKHHYLISFNRLCVRNILNCQEKLEVPRISLWDLEGFIPPQLHFNHPILGQVWYVMIFVPQKQTLSNSDQPTFLVRSGRTYGKLWQFILGITGDGQRLVAAMGCRPNLLEQVEVPQAAVVTDYSDAIVIDQEASRMTGTRKHSWMCLKMGTYSPVGDS